MDTFKNGDNIIIECCNCGLQHIWTLKIVRGKTPLDDVVEAGIYPVPKKQEDFSRKGR